MQFGLVDASNSLIVNLQSSSEQNFFAMIDDAQRLVSGLEIDLAVVDPQLLNMALSST